MPPAIGVRILEVVIIREIRVDCLAMSPEKYIQIRTKNKNEQ